MIPDHIIEKAARAKFSRGYPVYDWEKVEEHLRKAHRDSVTRTLAPVYADIQAEALRQASDRFGVYVGDEESPWRDGYRQAQRETIFKLADLADELNGSKS